MKMLNERKSMYSNGQMNGKGYRNFEKTRDMERIMRNGTPIKLYADEARPLVLRPSAENPDGLSVRVHGVRESIMIPCRVS